MTARGQRYFEPLLPTSAAASSAQLEGEADRLADAALLRPLLTPLAGAAPPPEASALDAPGLQEGRAGGRALDPAAQTFAESRLGHSFAGVRIHTDAGAAASAAALNARAFALGQHVVFGAGEYQPHTPIGQRLLLHELVHTLQMARPGARPWIARTLQNNCSTNQDDVMLREIGVAAEMVDHAIFLLTGRLHREWYVDASEAARIDAVFFCPSDGDLQTLIAHLVRVRQFLNASFPYNCMPPRPDASDRSSLAIGARALSGPRDLDDLRSGILRHALLLAGISMTPDATHRALIESGVEGAPQPSRFAVANYHWYLSGTEILPRPCPSQPPVPAGPTPAEPSREPRAMTSNDLGSFIDTVIVVSRVGGRGTVTGWDWEPRGAEHPPALGPIYDWFVDSHRDRIFIVVDGQRLDLLHRGRVAPSGPASPAPDGTAR
ncbi:MAG: DUF4157 domain-containing protein [Cyanobacteriota bacterium]|nr:DUF4157 domain-containing protein [Cyanobacteriota bacterium]